MPDTALDDRGSPVVVDHGRVLDLQPAEVHDADHIVLDRRALDAESCRRGVGDCALARGGAREPDGRFDEGQIALVENRAAAELV
jgi:hypothetical protein